MRVIRCATSIVAAAITIALASCNNSNKAPRPGEEYPASWKPSELAAAIPQNTRGIPIVRATRAIHVLAWERLKSPEGDKWEHCAVLKEVSDGNGEPCWILASLGRGSSGGWQEWQIDEIFACIFPGNAGPVVHHEDRFVKVFDSVPTNEAVCQFLRSAKWGHTKDQTWRRVGPVICKEGWR
jgi:hypothetical protein